MLPFSVIVQGAGDAAASKRIWLARKKVYFFIVFSNEFADDLSPLSKVVDIEYGMNRHYSLILYYVMTSY